MSDISVNNILDTFDHNIVLLDMKGTIVDYNNKWKKFAVENDNPSLINSDIGSNYLEVTKRAIIDEDENSTAKRAYLGIKDVLEGIKDRFDLEYPCHSPDEKRWFIMHARKVSAHDRVVIYHENVSKRKKAEQYRNLYSKILSILNESSDYDKIIARVCLKLKNKLEVNAIGIRLKENTDYPFFYQNGFSKRFLDFEDSIIVKSEKQFFCAIVGEQERDSSNHFLTEYGSLIVNDPAVLNGNTIESETETETETEYDPRMISIQEGYSSIAMIPIKIENNIIGIFQLNGYKKNLFNDTNIVDLLEDIASNIGHTIKRKQTEAELKKALLRLQSFFEYSPLLIGELTPDGTYERANRALNTLLGSKNADIVGSNLDELLDIEIANIYKSRLSETKEKGDPLVVEDTLTVDGEEKVFRTVLFPLYDENNKIISIGSIGEDITDMKRLEELEKSNLIVQEIHHRVKNNLQVIISLLNMQARLFSYDHQFKNALVESQNRIRSMALAHEKLYKADSIAHVEISSYISDLVDYVTRIYGTPDKKISIHKSIDKIHMDMDLVVPLGLLINEIVTNSYKHAFVGREQGNISISFESHENENANVLVVKDDGIGMPDDLDVDELSSVGYRIIKILSQQLSATMDVSNSNGTCYKLVFKKQ